LLDAYLGKNTGEALRDTIIHHSLHGYFSIRQGRWKLTPHLGSGGFSQPEDNDPAEAGKAGSLYDMAEDPGETMNLYNVRPEIVRRLESTLLQAKTKGGQNQK
ncbi:MAG: sulfatase, partial [Kiritimatiellae bacterium]|nr:sulfatase [Kiritimatiellia bacterium]